MQMVVQGVSTRRVKKITTELCGREFSRSTVSRLTGDLDEQVGAWAERPLDEHAYPFLVLDATQVKVRRQGAVRSTTVLLAVGVRDDGQRELLGLETAFGETREAWRRFIGDLKRRGLCGVEVATSDAHEGLTQALQEAFPGLIWQRCQAHFRRNVLDQTPASARKEMKQGLDQVLQAASPQQARERFEELRDELSGEADAALDTFDDGLGDATAVLALPEKYRRRLRTTNMLERFIEEIQRRVKVIRIFPDLASAERLIGALCAETHEEWSTGRRYLIMDAFAEWKQAHAPEPTSSEPSEPSSKPTTESPAAVAA